MIPKIYTDYVQTFDDKGNALLDKSGYPIKQYTPDTYTCKLCPTSSNPVFPKPKQRVYKPASSMVRQATGKYSVTEDRTDSAELEALHNHAITVHGYKRCPKCNAAVANVKAHQKSAGCEEKRRHTLLTEQGYFEISTQVRILLLAITVAKAKELNSLPFEEHYKYAQIQSKWLEVEHEILKKANIIYAPTGTSHVRDIEGSVVGWEWQYWGTEQISVGLQLLCKLYEQRQTDLVDEFSRFINLDEENQFAQLSGWELMLQK